MKRSSGRHFKEHDCKRIIFFKEGEEKIFYLFLPSLSIIVHVKMLKGFEMLKEKQEGKPGTGRGESKRDDGNQQKFQTGTAE